MIYVDEYRQRMSSSIRLFLIELNICLGEKDRHGVAACVPLRLRLLRPLLLHQIPRHRGQHVHRITSWHTPIFIPWILWEIYDEFKDKKVLFLFRTDERKNVNRKKRWACEGEEKKDWKLKKSWVRREKNVEKLTTRNKITCNECYFAI